MWQVVLAAAVAGSGYFAKQILQKNDFKSTNHSLQNTDLPTEASISDQEISPLFRFSSASHGSKKFRKKLGRNGGKFGSEKKIGDQLCDDQKKNAKKFVVCLKKRRTGRNTYAKCDSVDVKDKSSFGYGVGVGIMYMISAGKAEIDRLNTAVDKTSKIVEELKTEIFKRKSFYDLKFANRKRENNNDIIQDYGFPMSDEGGYASSILTEEPHVEIDQLEAELESELLKLQISTIENSSNKISTEYHSKPQDLDLESNQCNGVTPYELDKRLSHLLIEQQESQIVDLESELQHTNSKLLEKESELQALKDCVKRLTSFSLACPSDEEREDKVDEADNKMINGNARSMVGIKRAIDFD